MVIELNQHFFSEYDLNEILKSSQANKLVLFIGAGFSKFSETELVRIPTWGELISELKDDLNSPKENDFLKIAQLYFLKYGQHSYVKKIKETIRDLDPSPFHKSLFELNPRYVITTNWDDLLEKTIQSLGLAYDLVSSDVELAQSNLDKKIIKMHGDFRQSNFVFKEDDYLQYNHNFPLIENFIKGVFSTNTVVFLGYSYNDYNLKQIISWVSNISKATPRKFLIQKDYDDAQDLYLRNHGISLLAPTKTNISYHDLYFKFFSELKVIENPDEYIKLTVTSSESKIEKIKNDHETSPRIKIELENEIKEFIRSKINKFFDKKLKVLMQYNVLLPTQISKKLTNSTIENDKNGVTLLVHDDLLTGDYDKQIRKIIRLYINDVLNENTFFKSTLLSVLEKSLITKVGYNSTFYNINPPSDIWDGLYEKISFFYSNDSAEYLFFTKRYGKLLSILSSQVKYHLNEGNYILATISMANFDEVYSMLKNNLSSRGASTNDSDKLIFDSFSPFDYKSKILDFPRELQADLQDLVRVIEFGDIYKAHYLFNVESRKNLEYAKTRLNGGIAYSNDEYKLRSKLYPYIYFVLGNDVLIEHYVEFQRLFEFNIIDSIKHYSVEGFFHVNMMDLFILIKYCENKKLKELSYDLAKDKKITKINSMDGKSIFRLKKYLLNTFNNICNLVSLKDKGAIEFTSVDGWLNNILIILGGVNWSSNQLKIIINNIIPLLECRTTNISLYEDLQYLISMNASLYQKSHSDMFKVLDTVLEKIIKKETNGYDSHIISSNNLQYIFNLSINHNYTYDNIALLRLLLLEIQSYNDETKKFITNRLLLNIKMVGSSEIVELIDEFVRSNICSLPLETEKDIIECLTLIANGYPIPENFLDVINKFISDNIPNKICTLDFIKARVETDFPELLKFLINEKNFVEFQSVLDNFNKRMDTLKNENNLD